MRGDGRTFQRGKVWWVAYWGPKKNGAWGEIRESSKSEREVDAQRLLRKRRSNVQSYREGEARAFQGPEQERVTIGELLDDLEMYYVNENKKSLRTMKLRIRTMREAFGHVRAVKLTPVMIREYQAKRRTEDGLLPASVNRECEILRKAFALAMKESGKVTRQPHIPMLPVSNKRVGFFEPWEIERMLKFLAPPLDDILRFGAICGWRRSECLNLRWENVNKDRREVRLNDSKNGEPRVLGLNDSAWALFEKLWAARSYKTRNGVAVSEFVFHRNGKPIGDSNFTKRWQVARRRAGLQGRFFHDLRRTVARSLVWSGVPEATAQAILGHRTNSTFRRYAIQDPNVTREALARQSAFMESRSSNVSDFQPRDSDKVSDNRR